MHTRVDPFIKCIRSKLDTGHGLGGSGRPFVSFLSRPGLVCSCLLLSFPLWPGPVGLQGLSWASPRLLLGPSWISPGSGAILGRPLTLHGTLQKSLFCHKFCVFGPPGSLPGHPGSLRAPGLVSGWPRGRRTSEHSQVPYRNFDG